MLAFLLPLLNVLQGNVYNEDIDLTCDSSSRECLPTIIANEYWIKVCMEQKGRKEMGFEFGSSKYWQLSYRSYAIGAEDKMYYICGPSSNLRLTGSLLLTSVQCDPGWMSFLSFFSTNINFTL